MKKSYIWLCAFSIALMLASCSLDDDRTNFRYETLETLSASLPDTFDFGSIYKVDVNVLRPDECTFSERFDVSGTITDTTNTRTIVPVGITIDEGECAVANDSIQGFFRFEVIYTEPYLFRFYSGDDANGEPEFLEIEVPVKQNP